MNVKKATCHPDRPHYAKGLCKSCYRKKRRAKNLEHCRAQEQKWRDENRERHRETQRKWHLKNPDWLCEYNEKNSERIKRKRAAYFNKRKEDDPNFVRSCHLWKIFGITVAEYNLMLKMQNGGCAICGKTPEENGRSLCVDHVHGTSWIRGLLCGTCNTGIGLLQDDPEILQKAIEYIMERENENDN